ncbi:MAG: YraN family protein [Pseudomonadota bacterium]
MTNNGAANTRRRRAEQSGRLAEFAASAAYILRGYQILERRFRAPQGEIDLIARRGRLLAFVEVKLRPDIDAAILAVTPSWRRRLERAAGSFLSLRPQFVEFAVRYDIAAVSGWRVAILTDAWRADP